MDAHPLAGDGCAGKAWERASYIVSDFGIQGKCPIGGLCLNSILYVSPLPLQCQNQAVSAPDLSSAMTLRWPGPLQRASWSSVADIPSGRLGSAPMPNLLLPG